MRRKDDAAEAIGAIMFGLVVLALTIGLWWIGGG